MAALGHRVVGYDVDPRKVDALSRAHAPFFEPGLEELLARTQGENLVFTHEMTDINGADVVFVAVGTPQRKGELAADTSYVTGAVESLAEVLSGQALIVGKSTVPVGTTARLAERLARTAPDLEVAWNPEFLREGHAVEDTLHPDRLVFGVVSARAEALLRRVYARPIAAGTPVVITDWATAELVKAAANSFSPPRSPSSTPSPRSPKRRARTSRPSPTPSATTTASAASSSTPGSGSAAAACPRTSARSWPGRVSSAPTRP